MALGATQRKGKYGRGMDPCAKIGKRAHGSISQREWIDIHVTVMKYEEYG